MQNLKKPAWLQHRYCRADELLHRLNMAHIPIDVLSITKMLDVPVFWNKTMEADGMLYMDLKAMKAEIHVKAGAPKNRFRFTVAHELGHLMMHDFDGTIHRDTANQVQNVKEREANSFAARLLIPTEQLLFYKQLAAGQFTTDHVQELAPTFNVSYDTMYYRIKNMGWLA